MTATDYTTDPEYRLLHLGMRQHPDDDAYRLALADWIRHEGDDDCRADFIEVQIAIAKGGYNPKCERHWARHYAEPVTLKTVPCRDCWKAEKERERELFEAHAVRWFDTPGLDSIRLQPYREELMPAPYAVVRSGWISEVRLTAAAFLDPGHDCHRCTLSEDFGETGYVPLVGGWTRCQDCGGSGRVGGLAGRLFREHPITTVRLTDKRPQGIHHRSGVWMLWYTGGAGTTSTITRELFATLEGGETEWDGRPWRSDGWTMYPTEESAMSALSLACVAFGRKAAGLPPLTRQGAKS